MSKTAKLHARTSGCWTVLDLKEPWEDAMDTSDAVFWSAPGRPRLLFPGDPPAPPGPGDVAPDARSGAAECGCGERAPGGGEGGGAGLGLGGTGECDMLRW